MLNPSRIFPKHLLQTGLLLSVMFGLTIPAGAFNAHDLLNPPSAGDVSWWDGFGYPGVSGGGVDDLVVYQGALIVAGWFTEGPGPGNGIARWDGASWSTLDTGINGRVYALFVHENILYAGGDFTMAGGAPASCIAKWDGSSWSAMGSGITNGAVRTIAYYGGYIVAGGGFTTAGGVAVSNVARWRLSTQAWSAMSLGISGEVRTLARYGVYLYAGGSFSQAGGVAASNIAIWTSVAWTGVGSGTNGPVNSLLSFAGDLVVGGQFTLAGGTSARNIARWNDVSWSAFGSGATEYYYDYVLDMASLGSDLYITGNFSKVDGGPALCVAQWNGSAWSGLGSGLYWCCTPNWQPDIGRAVATFGGSVYAGGFFQSAGGVHCENLGRWDGTTWNAIKPGSGLDNRVSAMGRFEGSVITAGIFQWTGLGDTVAVTGRWDGNGWQCYGAYGQYANWLGEWNGSLYSGGDFNVLRRNETTALPPGPCTTGEWVVVGPLSHAQFGRSRAFASYGGRLATGGRFSTVSGVAAANVAAWDGTIWEALGSGVTGGAAPEVHALTVYDGRLIAGGSFTTAGGIPAANIAAWDGVEWLPLGAGINGTVYALCSIQNVLVAGGIFTDAGGAPASNVAVWNGSIWAPLGSGTDGKVSVLVEHLGALVAGGEFTTAGGQSASRIAMWDFALWSPLGSGLNNTVTSLLSDGATLHVGGYFTRAGGKRSFHIARWDGAVSSAGDRPAEPQRFHLAVQSNPFRGATRIRFQLESAGPIRLAVHDVQGRLVQTLADGWLEAGTHHLDWSPRRNGRPVSPGAYWLRIEASGRSQVVKVVLLP